MPEKTTQELENDNAFIKAGFTAEQVGSVTIYKRAVSDDVIEAAIQFAEKRTIGYRSPDIHGRRKDKQC